MNKINNSKPEYRKMKTEILSVNRAFYLKKKNRSYNQYFSFLTRELFCLALEKCFNYLLNKCWWHISLQNLILSGLNSLFSNLHGKTIHNLNINSQTFKTIA